MGAVWHEKEKEAREAPAVLWREEKKTLTLCGEPVLEETLAWPEFEGKGLGRCAA